MTIRATLVYAPYLADYELYLTAQAYNGKTQYLTKLQFEERPNGFSVDPIRTTALPDGHAVGHLLQAIMDASWDAGLRPTGFTDVKNETKAIRAHLEDMRAIAFAKSEVPKP